MIDIDTKMIPNFILFLKTVQKELKQQPSTDEAALTIQKGMSEDE